MARLLLVASTYTRADVLLVDQSGEVLGRPWLTIVIDTYSRCIMGMHMGFDAPSAWVVCLALRHAILPKQYSNAYESGELGDVWFAAVSLCNISI